MGSGSQMRSQQEVQDRIANLRLLLLIAEALARSPSVARSARSNVLLRHVVGLIGHVGRLIIREPAIDERRRFDKVDTIVTRNEVGKKEVNVSSNDTEDLTEGIAANEKGKSDHSPRQIFRLELQTKHE